jgi:hypothetical protein
MGLRIWKGENITKTDAEVAKNYLADHEIRELNRVTTILLDIFEDQLDIGKLATMTEAERLLDTQPKSLSRPVLNHGGVVKSTAAKSHANEQYQLFDEKRKAIRRSQADAALAALKATDKQLPKGAKVESAKRPNPVQIGGAPSASLARHEMPLVSPRMSCRRHQHYLPCRDL